MSKYLLKNKDKIVLEFEVKNLEIQSLVSKTKELTQKIKNIHIIFFIFAPTIIILLLFLKYSKFNIQFFLN